MNVTLRDLDLDAARAYVDSLPFFGTLSGTHDRRRASSTPWT